MPRKLSASERHRAITRAITARHLDELGSTRGRDLPKTPRWNAVRSSVQPRPSIEEIWTAVSAANEREVRLATDRSDAERLIFQFEQLTEMAAAFRQVLPFAHLVAAYEPQLDAAGRPRRDAAGRAIFKANPAVNLRGTYPDGDDVVAALDKVAALVDALNEASDALDRAVSARVPVHRRAEAVFRSVRGEQDRAAQIMNAIGAAFRAGQVPDPSILDADDETRAKVRRLLTETNARRTHPADVRAWAEAELMRRGWSRERVAQAMGTSAKTVRRRRLKG